MSDTAGAIGDQNKPTEELVDGAPSRRLCAYGLDGVEVKPSSTTSQPSVEEDEIAAYKARHDSTKDKLEAAKEAFERAQRLSKNARTTRQQAIARKAIDESVEAITIAVKAAHLASVEAVEAAEKSHRSTAEKNQKLLDFADKLSKMNL